MEGISIKSPKREIGVSNNTPISLVVGLSCPNPGLFCPNLPRHSCVGGWAEAHGCTGSRALAEARECKGFRVQGSGFGAGLAKYYSVR